jgi:hypothetical protein
MEAPACGGRCSGKFEQRLGENDVLFLHGNGTTPLVMLPRHVWERILKKIRRAADASPMPGSSDIGGGQR